MAATVDADHLRKAPATSGLDARERVLNNRCACRIYSQSSGRLEEDRRIGLPFQTQLTGVDPIHPRLEEVGDPRRLQYVDAVTRCGNDRRSTVAGSKPVRSAIEDG